MKCLIATFCVLVLCPCVPIVDAITEVEALMAFRHSVSDPNNTLHDWDSTLVNPCTWSHITCDSQTVTRIDLGYSGLSGQLVSQLGDLTKLQYLSLNDNQLNGPIPSELSNLANLISLDLHSNSLSGLIPHDLGNLPKLTVLLLSYNNLSGCVPFPTFQVMARNGNLNISNNPGLITEWPPCHF